ncbi:MAG: FHA domain-containing protein [Bryobacteraceae bacterium]
MIQCNAGHFYDEQRHSVCPYCATPIDIPPPGRTVAMRSNPASPQAGAAGQPSPASPTQPMRPAAGATVRLVEQNHGIDPVVGWLVCVEGPDRGQDFRLRAEKNFIGRDPSMDVTIAGDNAVSRLRHAAVAFEPEKREFWVIPGDSAGLVYLNDEVVHSPAPMRHGDALRIGKSRLTLVAFAGENFQWD